MVDNKKLIPIVVAAAFLIGGVAFWFWSQKEVQEPIEQVEQAKDEGVVETAKNVSESVPEIETNVGEKVPETNPIDRANPYKYTNPLR